VFKTKSDWTYHILPNGDIHVTDLNLGNMSVTNDAEAVIEALHSHCNLVRRRVQYTDSEGQIDQLLHNNGVFTNFAPGPIDD